MFKKLSRMLAVVAAAILMLTAVGTAVQAEEAVTGDTFLAQVVGDYQPLFEGATLNPEYDHYWHDYAAAVVGASAADDVVAYVKSSINAPGYGEQAAAPNFYCGFIDDVTAITFGGEDGKTVTYTKADGASATYTYAFVRDGAAKGTYGEYEMAMEGYLYKAQEEDAGVFQYLLMFPDTPATTYHLEFRYADFMGTGNLALTAEYTFFAFDSDATDEKDAGTYIAMNSAAETVTPGAYEIVEEEGKTALVFTSNEGVITYILRNE